MAHPSAPDLPGDDDRDGLDPGAAEEVAPPEPDPAPRRRLPRWLPWSAAALAALLALTGVAAWRRHQERRIVAASVARARDLLRSDTWLGAHEAAALLGLKAARVDAVEAAPLRAFALALLAADWRDRGAASEAAALADAAQRASEVSPAANLATAALALAERRAGTAIEYTTRAGDGAWPQVLAARVALQAGNPSAALEAADRAVAADPDHPAALALRGDLLRRSGRAAEAKDAYGRAIATSAAALAAGYAGNPLPPGASAPHARATFGLAKLALTRRGASPDDAVPPLERLLGDAAGTPQVERARAALYLAALRGRAGDRAGATAAVEATGLGSELRTWLERAAGQLEVERGDYRVPDRTPAALESAADDDPWVAPPPPPPASAVSPAKQTLHGFKVHGPAKPKPSAHAVRKTAAKKKSQKKPAATRDAPPAR
jgi:tetratricopeptide (TPR) repeat protein